MINYYELLLVESNASKTAITKAGKELKKELQLLDSGHPDDLAGQKIELIELALETLTISENRSQYDKELIAYLGDKSKKDENKIDYSEYLLESADFWESLLPNDITDPLKRVDYLFDLIIDLPNSEIAKPLLLSFLLTPSAISTCIPVAFTWGKSGVGKSQPSKFGAALWGNRMLLSKATYASIRNHIQRDRWHDAACSRGERNYILAWDDVDYAKMTAPDGVYTLLKGGYSRSSSLITIAGERGENIEFDIFGSKIFSSIYPFFGNTKLSELKRRMLVIPMAKAKRQICDFDEISWKGLSKLTTEIWTNKENLNNFVKFKRQLRSHFKRLENQCLLSVDRQNLFTDVLTTGLTLGIFESIEQAIATIETHEENMEKLSNKEQDGLSQVLSIFVNDEILEAVKTGSKVRIRPDKLKDFIGVKVRGGELDGFPRRGEIPLEMRKLGFSLNADLGAWERAEE